MNKILLVISLLLLVVLSACGAEPEVIEVTRVVTEKEAVEVEVTKVVEVEKEVETVVEVTREVEVEVPMEPEPEPVDRKGGWLDTIVIVEEPNQDAAIARLAAGDLDMYADDIGSPALVQSIADAGNIQTRIQFGLFDEIFFNNGACADQTMLNPFQNNKVREAMNWAIDRDYVADELYGGLAIPKYAPIVEAGADRARLAADIRAVEATYPYDLEKAREIITTEMEGMGATMEDGKWTFNGAPINLIGLIRIEDTRLEIGNYVANQLEDLGFTVERVERTSAELSPLWISSDPTECLWNWYTGAWSQNYVERVDVLAFEQYYTDRVLPWPSQLIFETPERLSELSLRTFNNDFADMEERTQIYQEAMPYAFEMSPRVWVTSRTTLVPFSTDVVATTDLAGGISGFSMWAKPLRFKDEVGGSMTIGLPSVFTQPWNPVGGSNWVFDAMVQSGIIDPAFYTDPYTGLYLPNRVERAEVIAQEGFPMSKTLDWVDLSFAPEIIVPDDAWVDWDAENQVFLTAAEVYTQPTTAVFKSTTYFPEDFFETVKWHDGSPMSVADFVMDMIIAFDLADENSPYYDESLVPTRDQLKSAFKGVRIASTDPLVIEHWGDNPALDAENTPVTWYPTDEMTGTGYNFGDAAWHNMAVMLRGEENGDFAFTPEKSEANEIERTNLVGGPSLDALAANLEALTEEGSIPYEPTLGQFLSEEEIASRYGNLAEFARRYGHYYVGNGPYFLQGVFPVEGQAILQHNPDHPDASNRWDRFGPPPLPVIEIDGPGRVTIGQEEFFDVYVDVFDGPYPMDDIDYVQYLLFDASGTLAESGEAVADSDGLWVVTLSGDTTSKLEEGSNRLDVVVVSRLVALPATAEFPFVTAP